MKFFTPLTDDQVIEIHNSSLKVLEETGYIIKDIEALDIFKKAGARVDYDKELVKISHELVEKALKSMPKKLTLYGKKESIVELGAGKVYFMNGYGSVNVFDWKTCTRRPNTKQDLINFTRVANQMENEAVYYNEVTPQEFPAEVLDVHNAQVVLEFIEKPVFLEVFTIEGLKDIIKMLKIINKDDWIKKPTACFQLCIITPLLLDQLRTRLLIEVAKEGAPLVVGTLPQSGGTAPATLAGTLVVQNAETLGAITLTQLINPGTAFLLNNFGAIMDQRFGVFASGGPEEALLQGATAQLCHFYGLPQIGTAGSTESNCIDVQAGYEKAMTILYSALTGVELIHGAVSGWIQSVLSHCLAQVVVSDEICSYVRRILDGIEFSKDTLAVDVIKEIGPGGNFLMHQHTLDHFKKEDWEPPVSRRLTAPEWEQKGKKNVLDYAQEKVDKILAEDPVSFISRSAKEDIGEIVKEADKRVSK